MTKIKKRRSLLLFFQIFFLFLASTEACIGGDFTHLGMVQIKDLSAITQFTLTDPRNLSTSDLKIVFSWNVGTMDGSKIPEFDGFIYTFKDNDEDISRIGRNPYGALNQGFPNAFPPPSIGFLNYENCQQVHNASIWTTSNGKAVQCQIPCTEYLARPCNFSNLCTNLANNYKAISMERRSIELPATFARRYDFALYLYKDWDVGMEHKIDTADQMVFCRDFLITKHSVDLVDADRFCKRAQQMPTSLYATGPPTDFEEAERGIDLTTNRGYAIFRWKAPYDIDPNADLAEFFINSGGNGNQELDVREPYDPLDRGYYITTITELELNVEHMIKITPAVKWNTHDCPRCTIYGDAYKEYFTIHDIDGCDRKYGICDENALCYDVPANFIQTAANCTCPEGFIGNGINKTWGSLNDIFATGCVDYFSCDSVGYVNATCDSNAICSDISSPNVTNSIECACKDGYIGDGYRSSSGCVRTELVIALGVGLPLMFITVTLMFVAFRRFRITKKRSIEKTLSKFIVTKNGNYSAPLHMTDQAIVLGNTYANTQTSGLFGAKLEIDKEKIKFKGIIGRGNFGVVHKAVLETEDGNQLIAVKMMQDGHGEEVRNEFLAEIALIASVGSHDSLVGLIGCCTTDVTSIYLISEFMKYGDLLHFLWNAREPEKVASDPIYMLTELNIFDIGRQIAKGMKYLADIKIIHGDLAARNILVSEGLKCKISDFGLANDVYRYGMIKGATERKVPFKWVSPERMMAGKVPITWRSDVWSFGTLLYESITLGAAPFPDTSREDLFHRLQSGYRMEKPTSCSQNLYTIMTECWQWTPSKRPSFKQLENRLELFHTNNQQHNYVNLVNAVTSLDVEAYVTEINDEENPAGLESPSELPTSEQET